MADINMSLARRFEEIIGRSKVLFFSSLFLPLALIFSATADWTLPQDPDVLTIAVSAWQLGKTRSPFLPGHGHLTTAPYSDPMGSFRDSPGGPVSQYPPGAALLAAPLYALTPGRAEEHRIFNPSAPEAPPTDILLPSFWQATLIAVVSSAAAMALLGLAFLAAGGGAREAWVAGCVAALGTSVWSVASGALFMHGPAMLWISLALFLATEDRHWGSGLAWGAAILTRPHTAVIAACMGIGIGLGERSLSPTVRIGTGSSVGAGLFLLYNYYVWGTLTLTGGYSSAFTDRIVSGDGIWYARNLIGGLFDPAQGFLVMSPFLLILLPGLVRAWKGSDPSTRGAAIGGLIYLLLQFKMNRYNPGNSTLYRYPLEALTASATLWFASYVHWFKGRGNWHLRLLFLAVLFAVVLQGMAAWLM